jgi:SMC interacting uncharacterized protein involved in chromosome segregation
MLESQKVQELTSRLEALKQNIAKKDEEINALTNERKDLTSKLNKTNRSLENLKPEKALKKDQAAAMMTNLQRFLKSFNFFKTVYE